MRSGSGRRTGAARRTKPSARIRNTVRGTPFTSVQLFTNRYAGGADSYLPVIVAQTAALANQRNEIDILRRRMDASVLLVKAVGGGWDIAELPKP